MSESRTLEEIKDNSGSNTNHKISFSDETEGHSYDDHSTKYCADSVGGSNGRTSANYMWRSQNQMNWDSVNNSDGYTMDESHGEGPSSRCAPKLFHSCKVSSENENYDTESESESTESTNTYKARSSVKDEEYEELKQFRRENDNTRRETSTLEGINELIRKFSAIELLRRKENFKKYEEEANNESPSCSSSRPWHATAKRWNPEDLLGDGTFKVPDPKNDWKNIDCDEESDSDEENGKMRDMELIKMLVTHALGKEKQQGKKRGDEILTASYIESKTRNKDDSNDLCDSTDNQTEIVYEKDVYNLCVPTLTETGTESSLDHSEMFDGFEIDCPDSFQDWMLDSVLSKDINSSTDLEEKKILFLNNMIDFCGKHINES